MSFIVITSAEAYDAITEAGEMPGLLALGAEIVLVRPLYDELARDPASAAFIAASSPPFTVVDTDVSHRVSSAVADYLTDAGRDRVEAGEPVVIVMAAAGEWFVSRKPNHVIFAIAGEGMVDGIRAHLEGSGR